MRSGERCFITNYRFLLIELGRDPSTPLVGKEVWLFLNSDSWDWVDKLPQQNASREIIRCRESFSVPSTSCQINNTESSFQL